MSSTLYNKAFEAELKHDYYVYVDAPVNNEFAVNRNVAMVPTKECEQLMRRGRMKFVRTQKGFTMFYQGYIDGDGNQQPLVKLDNNSEFTFALYLDVASLNLFLNVTDLDVAPKTYGSGKFYMLEQTINDGSAPPPMTSSLIPSLANSLKSSVFNYSFQPNPDTYIGDADVVVYLNGGDVLTIQNIPYNTITKGYSVEINLRDQPKGFYTLTAFEAGTSNPINTNDFYVDSDLLINGAFGIVKIKYATIARLYDTTSDVTWFTAFQYTFSPREVKWRYYIVAENLESTFFSNWDLTVIKSGGPVFNASYHPPDSAFDQPLGQPDPSVPVNGLRTVVFESEDPIAFNEAPRQGFDLYRTPVGGGVDTKIISNLANPNSIGVDSDSWGPAQTPIQTPEKDISEIYVYI
jgi:hypothetical protein